MCTTASHIAQSATISYWLGYRWSIFQKWYMIAIAMVLGAMPDLVRFLQKDTSDWNDYYKWAHHTWYCYFIPYWNIHIFEDLLVHKQTGGMNALYIPLEILTWVLIALSLYYFITHRKAE